MAIHSELEKHVRAQLGSGGGLTITGTNATISSSLDHHQLDELMTVAWNARYDVKLVAGVLTLTPRLVG